MQSMQTVHAETEACRQFLASAVTDNRRVFYKPQKTCTQMMSNVMAALLHEDNVFSASHMQHI